jgi:propionyl-CoA carboxylase alpha chain
MFSKILIANRGEIACRVIRTARRMGIATVAVHSDADAMAPHVAMADEAVRLGPPPAAESYLREDLLLAACRETGAEAVHPGYGFLSERESFARLLTDNGIAFIGPPPKAIAAMGDKIESKRIAEAAKVSVVPGFIGEIRDADHAAEIAAAVGYPVMMKASAGGGGKGMRLAGDEKALRESFDSVRREGLASFGDDRLLIEKVIANPRHIEIQVLGDRHGNLVHLGERECSIQRRHQKVVEEAPSPFVTPEMREAMGAQAVALARQVGYFSTGTVEFIAGADRSFYFLEMNTRLQVEHPVTECVTGLDLVEQMIRVAAGEKLGFAQADIRLDGWSIETRVYAEDPYRGFLPSTGRLIRYRPPPRWESVRVDDGVIEGGEVSMFYDPMIAKLVTTADSREKAIGLQIEALDSFWIEGVGNNVDFLSALMQHPRFQAGELTTGFIAEEYPDGFHGAPADDRLLEDLARIAALASSEVARRAGGISGQLNGPPPALQERIVRLAGREYRVAIDRYDGGFLAALDGGTPADVVADWQPGQSHFNGTIDGRARIVKLARRGMRWRLVARGAAHDVTVLPAHVAPLAQFMIERAPPDLSNYLICPMPGLLTALHVKEGDTVQPGQPLAVVEAMKMENILRAQRPAVVSKIQARPGDSLAVDAVILEFEPAA